MAVARVTEDIWTFLMWPSCFWPRNNAWNISKEFRNALYKFGNNAYKGTFTHIIVYLKS